MASVLERRWLLIVCILLIACVISGCSEADPAIESGDKLSYEVKNVFPHNTESFTQGLVFMDGVLYEGTGGWGESALHRVDLETGDILQTHWLFPDMFGEGITIVDDRIIQLTWRSGVGFVYSKDDFELLREFSYPWEGWGITYDGDALIVSDGTNLLHFLDPQTFQEIGQIEVLDGEYPVNLINELEFVGGEVYANIWKTDLIARISPDSGQVIGWVDLQGIIDTQGSDLNADVLNGIAYDSQGDRLFVTGKLWPYLFEIVLVSE